MTYFRIRCILCSWSQQGWAATQLIMKIMIIWLVIILSSPFSWFSIIEYHNNPWDKSTNSMKSSTKLQKRNFDLFIGTYSTSIYIDNNCDNWILVRQSSTEISVSPILTSYCQVIGALAIQTALDLHRMQCTACIYQAETPFFLVTIVDTVIDHDSIYYELYMPLTTLTHLYTQDVVNTILLFQHI